MKRGRVSGFTSTSVKDVLARVVGAQPLAGSARLEPPQALTAVLRDLLDDGSTLRLAPPRDGADDPPTLLGVVRLLWAWHQGLDETCSEGRLQAFLSSQDLQSDDDTRKRVGLTARSLRDALRTNAELRRDVMKAPSRER